VNRPTREIGATDADGEVVTRANPTFAWFAEMPASNPDELIEIPETPVAVSVLVTPPLPPPSTRIASVMLMADCVMSALMTVVLPDPAMVNVPVPVTGPFTTKSPPPPGANRAVTARPLLQALVTVIVPVFVVLRG
jgi:hypothetical protein